LAVDIHPGIVSRADGRRSFKSLLDPMDYKADLGSSVFRVGKRESQQPITRELPERPHVGAYALLASTGVRHRNVAVASRGRE
jgi:hypothetical protein